MQISPINNTSFNGRFKKTTELEKLLKYSDKNTLYRFNEVLERAKKVDDKRIFKISSLSNFELNSYGKTSIFHFHLLSHPENNEYLTEIEAMKSFQYNHNLSKKVLWGNYANILKSFLPTLENLYPKVEFENSSAELIEKINNKLI